ncbi:hypothetical protein [Rhizohabitans arisaemae]|uniref:hypothetical protein n=1 Tax=Rhizohabitans arisaemae TaxID=2720610 RepID=UPI0024B27152|nr:hypothetical protein [Rhizohabitans arisaemae]
MALSECELASAVFRVPLVVEARSLAEWEDGRSVDERGFPVETPAGLREPALAWVVAVNGGLARVDIEARVAHRGPNLAVPDGGTAERLMELWDGVVMDVLDQAEDGVIASRVAAELPGALLRRLAEGESVRDEELFGPGGLSDELRGGVGDGLDLFAYCGLVEHGDGVVALTPLGHWGLTRDAER